jgi:hypothetical protein
MFKFDNFNSRGLGAFLPAFGGQKPGFSGHGHAAPAGGGASARRFAAPHPYNPIARRKRGRACFVKNAYAVLTVRSLREAQTQAV